MRQHAPAIAFISLRMSDTPRHILITGAASGIGRATALLFAQRGWRVLANDINAPALQALVQAGGAAIVPLPGDVSTRAGAQALAAQAAAHTGGTLDALFNCAGLLAMGPHAAIAPERIDRLLAVNVNGVVHGIDALRPLLLRGRDPHIVSMCSASAEYGVPDHAVYSASKFFVRGLTEALDIEFARDGIQVSAVLVSYVRTPMVLQADVQAASVARLGVKVAPERVAATVWRAVHGRRTLWRVGLDAKLLNLAVRLLGGASRGLLRRLTGQ
jgi:NAD(P)-dependent dehydrogenase (short-subunit alcohol dehydrogenase family)